MKRFHFLVPPRSMDAVLRDLKTKPASQWEKKGEQMALKLFEYTYKTVPAYRRFLCSHGIDGNKIRTIQDFKTLPITDKESYLKKYEYRDLFPNRDLSGVTTISATSGSTGEPFYFPRGEEQDAQYEYIAELFLKNQFEIDKKPTLGIIGFGLGIWIGGIFTYKNFNKIAAKGYKLALLPVGPNKELYLKSIKKFGQFFDQVLLMGLPPFIKDIIDEAKEYDVNWKEYRVKIMTATETFSEEFRDYLITNASINNPFTDIINIFGTVELGTMAHETALTTLIRRIAVGNPKVFSAIFPHSDRLPTLTQYHPQLAYFEVFGDEVIGSGFGSSIPLLRYRFLDMGDVVPFDTMVATLEHVGVDIFKEARRVQIADTVLKLPFVYVYERSDFSTTLFGIMIYPEYIRSALHKRAANAKVTGKFTMITKTDIMQNQFLEINIELKKNIKGGKRLEKVIQDAVVDIFLSRSTEYQYLYSGAPKVYKERLKPKITLWPYEHELHFKPGGKQKWVKR